MVCSGKITTAVELNVAVADVVLLVVQGCELAGDGCLHQAMVVWRL